MIPTLFEAGETKFVTNGLGRMADAARCIVTEERNGAFELEMDYPIDGIHFGEIEPERIIFATPADGANPQAFVIYRMSKPISGIVTVYARHLSYRLSKIPTERFEDATQSAASALTKIKENALVACPFDFWTDVETAASYRTPEVSSIRARLGGVEGSILDCYGGEYEWDNWTVKLHTARGADNGVTIRYGKNLTDITHELDTENMVTGLVPFWRAEDVNGKEQYISGGIVYVDGMENYQHHKVVPLDLSADYEDQPTATQLREAASAYIKANDVGKTSINTTICFVALWQTEEYKNIAALERVQLCDTVHVEYGALGVNVTAKVIRTEYDVLLNRYNEVELGSVRENLSSAISAAISGVAAEKRERTSQLQQAISRATSLIQGGRGGNVVFARDANGTPKEILILDTDDINTAVNVLRINKNGIGFSSHGYNGPFHTAWTLDGNFVADYITGGTFNAALIKAGILMDEKGTNYWNMETGDFRLSAANALASLTNNGQYQGIYLTNGQLYINGQYITALEINATDATLNGGLKVYREGDGVFGGKVGYLSGSDGKNTTHGIGIRGPTEDIYAIVTASGVRAQAGRNSVFLTRSGATINAPLTVYGDVDVYGHVTDGKQVTGGTVGAPTVDATAPGTSDLGSIGFD